MEFKATCVYFGRDLYVRYVLPSAKFYDRTRVTRNNLLEYIF